MAHFLFSSLVVFVCAFCCICAFNFIMSCEGKFLLLAIVSIFYHSIFLLFVMRGSVNILWIRWRYAAILCSVGWLEVNLIVVSVVVGLRNMSMSIAVGCRISSRSRKFMVLFCSSVGVKCRLVCILFIWSLNISGMMCVMLYIMRMSSTYRV